MANATFNVVTVVKDTALKTLASTIEGITKVAQGAKSKLQEAASGAETSAHRAAGVRKELLLQAANVSQLYVGLRSAVSGLQGVLGSYAEAYSNAAVASKKLEVVMRQRMAATDEDIKSIKAVTSAQKELGVIGGSVQNAGAQQVSTFLTQASTLRTLIPAMNNLLAQQKGVNATQEDAVSIGNLMGKAMQGQTSALRRVGITFTEAEEQILKYGSESERAATLAKVITNNVGEMNAKLAQTDAGKMKQLQNYIGGIKAKIGSIVVGLQPYLAAASQVAILVSSFGQLYNVVRVAGVGLLSFGRTLLGCINIQKIASTVSLAFAFVQKGLAAAFGISTVAAGALTTALLALGAALIIGPIIWGIVEACRAFSSSSSDAGAKTRQLAESQQAIARAHQRATESTAENILVINTLSKRVHDNNVKLSERKKALERLKQLVPGYLASYTKEGKLINDNTDALTRYIAKLKEKAYVESLKQEMVEAYTKQRQAQREVDAKTTNVKAVEKELKKDKYKKSEKSYIISPHGASTQYETNGLRDLKLEELNLQKAAQKAAQQKLDAANALLKSLDAEAQKRKEAFAANINNSADNLAGSNNVGGGYTGSGRNTTSDNQDDEARKLKEKRDAAYNYAKEENDYAAKLSAERIKNEQEAQQQEINMMQEGKDRELAQIRLNYEKQKQEAENYRKEEIEQLQAHWDKLWELDPKNKEAKEKGERNPQKAYFSNLTYDQKFAYAAKVRQAGEEREGAINKVEAKYAAPARLEELRTVEELTKAVSYYQQISAKQIGEELYATEKVIAAHEEKLNKIRGAADLLKERKEVADISALGERELKIKVRAIGVEELTARIERLQKQLSDNSNPVSDSQRKDIEALIQTYTQWRATSVYSINTVRTAWGGIQGIGDSVSSLVDTLEGTGSAWQKITASVQAFFSVMDGLRSIIEVVKMIETVSKATTAAKVVETGAITANTSAITTEASVAITASLAKAAANNVEGTAAVAAAVAKIFAAHSSIPFAGVGIAAGLVALMIGTLASIPKFADGGIAYGPTVGLFGEYAGASHNPEVVAPLDRLRSLIAPQQSGGGQVEFRIEGRQLVGILNKESRYRSRNF
jgi:hypothetical protein